MNWYHKEQVQLICFKTDQQWSVAYYLRAYALVESQVPKYKIDMKLVWIFGVTDQGRIQKIQKEGAAGQFRQKPSFWHVEKLWNINGQ
jgi:hypothetical protein